MLTESEVKLARYNETAKEPDVLGRLISVRRLRPSEQTKVSGMTAELSGSDRIENDQGEAVFIPHRMPLIIAAAVCMINEDYIPFPRNRAELDAIYDRLDVEGLAAAGKAFARLQGVEVVDPLGAAKNL
jgi:hypothetical protein